jgi:hypothetical protein
MKLVNDVRPARPEKPKERKEDIREDGKAKEGGPLTAVKNEGRIKTRNRMLPAEGAVVTPGDRNHNNGVCTTVAGVAPINRLHQIGTKKYCTTQPHVVSQFYPS